MAQTDRQTNRQTNGHGDSKTNSAHSGRVGKNAGNITLNFFLNIQTIKKKKVSKFYQFEQYALQPEVHMVLFPDGGDAQTHPQKMDIATYKLNLPIGRCNESPDSERIV